MKIKAIIFLSIFLISNSIMAQLEGFWKAELDINGNDLVFYLRFESDKKAQIECGGEIIVLDEISYKNDTFYIRMPIFDTEFRFKKVDNKLEGIWKNNYRKTLNEITFSAEKATNQTKAKTEFTINGKWKTIFAPNTKDENFAIGIFNQKENKINGTFLTPTGDYRFLEGEMVGSEFSLSAFDGSHAFLFKGKLQNDTINGIFYSGIHYKENFIAIRDEKYELPDAEKLTYLKDGFSKISFSFPDLEGNIISLEDKKYKDKIVVVQLMGSWCPNCMDETKFMAEYYAKNKGKGVEFIALAFEKSAEQSKATESVKRLVKRYNAQHTFLIAGTSSKIEAAEKLPMLNSVLAFPTTIFIDKKGVVRKIHTGFNGPATGKLYEKFTEDFDRYIKTLIKE